MLQQTTVAVATPRWTRFLERFPNLVALSAADEESVLAEWSGLGYYSRARNLHRTARELAARRIGIPRSVKEWTALPGVGAYTAAAVCSIAFGERAAAVDGNIRRVLRRLHGISTSPGGSEEKLEIQALADAWIPKTHPGDHNQALMELGATVCLPRAPRCAQCPLRPDCQGFASGGPERFSTRPKLARPVSVRLAAGVALRQGRVVLVPDVWIVKGHRIVPLASVPAGRDAEECLRETWLDLAGRSPRDLVACGKIRHSVLNRRYTIELFVVTESARGGNRRDVALVAPARLGEVVRGALCDKLVSRALESSPPSRA